MSTRENDHHSLLIDYYIETTRLRGERVRHYETQSQALMTLAGTLLGLVAATAVAVDPPLVPVLLAVLMLVLAVVCSAQSRTFMRRSRDALLERAEDAVDRITEGDTHSAESVVTVWKRRAYKEDKEARQAAFWAAATLIALGSSSAPLAAVALSAAA